MLERQRYLFRRRGDLGETGSAYEILDADSHERTGIARVMPAPSARFFRRQMFRRSRPGRIEVRETEDESLIFTVTSAVGLLGRDMKVADADDNLVGSLKLGSWARSGVWICDADNRLFAQVVGDWRTEEVSMARPDRTQAALVTKEERDPSPGVTPREAAFIVTVDDRLAAEPFAKMLILGAILGLELYYRQA
jgi:hypothetical protein